MRLVAVVVLSVSTVLVASESLAQNPGGSAEGKKMKNPVAATAASVSAGQATFQKMCAFCHSKDASGNGPLAPTLVGFTFFASLVPIIGNLLSNAAITIAALTVSVWLGIASLGFLVVIHKLEYFLNARIVGGRTNVPTYGMLAAMLVLESAFGVAGLVAAPIYAAWLTRELREGSWV